MFIVRKSLFSEGYLLGNNSFTKYICYLEVYPLGTHKIKKTILINKIVWGNLSQILERGFFNFKIEHLGWATPSHFLFVVFARDNPRYVLTLFCSLSHHR